MLKVKLSLRAMADLRDIHDYGVNKFGLEQAEKYFDKINSVFLMLEDHPLIGLTANDIHQGYRTILSGRHMIYYKILGTDIRIIAILHERMNPILHFE